MKNIFSAALSLAFALFSLTAHSAPITVNYQGTVTSLGVLLEGDGVSIGSTVFGEFTYDADIAEPLFSFNINIGTFSSSLSAGGSRYFNVQNDQMNGSATLPADGFTLGGEVTTSGLNGYTDAGQQFGILRDNVDGQLWNDTLLPDLSDWSNITLADINRPDWPWLDFGVAGLSNFRDDQIRWDVSSFSVTAVPEASPFALLIVSLICFLFARKPR